MFVSDHRFSTIVSTIILEYATPRQNVHQLYTLPTPARVINAYEGQIHE